MAIDILNGWNTFSGEGLEQRAISATTKRGTSSRTTTTIKVCKTMKEVRESLQIDASAAVTYGDFSVDASAGDLKMLVPLETPEDRIKLFHKYGDSYISASSLFHVGSLRGSLPFMR